MLRAKNDSSQTNCSALFSKTTRDWFISSALYDGIEDEDLRQVETLLAMKGANPNTLLAEYGISPFHLAVANDNTAFALQATNICLHHGADPNVRSEDGLTPVHLAAMWGCREILGVLLASGGDPWLVDSLGMDAFSYALKYSQTECYNLLKTFADSQQRTQPPYQLNLKRVILYKNDLQIVYEPSPPRSQRCVATQTCNGSNFTVEVMEERGKQNNLICNKLNNCDQTSPIENKNCNMATGGKSSSCTENSRKEFGKQNGCTNEEVILDFNDHITVNNRLQEIIFHHRRNSTMFEYFPTGDGERVWSCMDTSNKCEQSNGEGSKLFEKLDQTNKLRQSLKLGEKQCDLIKNVTHRKKFNFASENPLSLLVEETFSNNSSEPTNEESTSNESPEFVSISKNDLSTSVGLILDNIDSTYPQTRGSSLFSDIASDVEAIQLGKEENVQNIDDFMTEDESLLKKTNDSTESLYLYVSCDDATTRGSETSKRFNSNAITRGSETSERFNSCMDKFPTEAESNNCSVNSEVHSLLDSILNNIHSEKTTPVNPNIVTSTPEKTPCDSNTNTTSTDSQKQKWVEAHLSSSDEELYFSISEEYEYTDLDEGVKLIEKRHLMDDIRIKSKTKDQTKSTVGSSSSEESEVSTISGSEGAYDTDDLRKALQERGYPVGPITSNTKRVYLRRLKRLRHRSGPLPAADEPAYSAELIRSLQTPCEHLLYRWAHLEDSMVSSFLCDHRAWRQGQAKTSFTYLLLDPALLPPHHRQTPLAEFWPHFLQAVFYVGKGKRARPYSHLYETVAAWRQSRVNNSPKIQRILDIWNSGQGVVCLHVFQNIIPVEALTREAAMICALTLQRLTNEKAGEFYGSASTWTMRLKAQLGCVLLHRACQVLLAEGERQLRPADID